MESRTRTIVWREGRRLAFSTPIVYGTPRDTERMNMLSDLRSRFHSMDALRTSGLPLLTAAKRVGLPRGAWDLVRARRPRPTLVSWQKRGRDKRGDAYSSSAKHITQDGMTTLCGQRIPPSETHDLRSGAAGDDCTCISCLSSFRASGGGAA